MQKNFNASTAPGSVAVAGLSEGGLCATTLALDNPKVYATFGNYSGFASPTYQDDNAQQTIAILFGGSKARLRRPQPAVPPDPSALRRPGGLVRGRRPGPRRRAGRPPAAAPGRERGGGYLHRDAARDATASTSGRQAFSDSLPWLSWKLKLTPRADVRARPVHRREERSRPCPPPLSSPSCPRCRTRAAPCCSGSPSWTGAAQARSAWKTAIDLIRQPMWLLGGLFLVGTFAFSALALYFGPLSVVQPVLVLELIFTLGLRVFLLHDDIAGRTWSAAASSAPGWAPSSWWPSPSEGSHVPDARQWIMAVSHPRRGRAGLLLLSRYGSPARRAALFGAATAVVWSLDAAFVKADRGRAGPRRRARAPDPLAAVRHGRHGRAGHHPVARRVPRSDRWPRPRPPCSSSTRWPASAWASSCSMSSCTPARCTCSARSVARRARRGCRHAVDLGPSGDDRRGAGPASGSRALRFYVQHDIGNTRLCPTSRS